MIPAVLPESHALFKFGNVRQEKGSKHLSIGELIEAINVRQTEEGPLTKRRGFDRTAPTFSGGSWTNSAESLLPGDGSSLLARDGADAHWAYDSASTTFRHRGTQKRVYPRFEAVMPQALTVSAKPVIVMAGDHIWVFAASTVATGEYYRTVFDKTTGHQILGQTTVAFSGIVSMSAAYDGTYVWLILVAGGNTATSHRYTASTPASSATTATYQTTTAGDQLTAVSVYRLSSPSETAVVVGGYRPPGGADAFVHSQSYLDPATGAARAAPAPVTTSNASGAAATYAIPFILEQTGATTWYYGIWRTEATNPNLYLVAVTTSTLATASTTALFGPSSTTSPHLLAGYVADNGDRVVYATHVTSSTRHDLRTVERYTYNGSVVTPVTVARGSWLASGPAKQGSTWYFLTGYDDVAVSPVTVSGIQRTLHLRDSDGNIVAQFANGEGPSMFHSADAATILSAIANEDRGINTPRLISTGTKLIGAVAIQTTGVTFVSPAKVEVEFSETYGKPVMMENRAIAPGGVPVTWSSNATFLHEGAPMLFPSHIRRTAGAGATHTAAAAVYRITDPDGRVWRSSPVLVAQNSGAGDTLEVPTLRHVLPNTRAEIEIYTGTTTPQLQGYVLNSTTVDTLTFVLPNPLRTDESLYTTGGALSNAPMPPFRAVGYWRERFFGAYRNALWFSQELEPGLGPRLNEVLRATWNDGTGEITAIHPLDHNYFVLFKKDAVAVISGAGPDGRGSGNYTAQTISTKHGCTATGSIAFGPGGCYFQSAQTGRICCITPGLQVVECAGGGDDYTAETVTAACHVESEGMMQFHTSGPRIICVDYRHPTEAAPMGQVYTWATSALLQGLGACVDNTGPVHIEAAGTLRRPGSGWQDAHASTPVDVLKSVTTGDLSPGGLQGEFMADWVTFLGTFSASSTVQITTYPDYSASGTSKALAITAAPAQIATRPPNCGRVQSIRCKIEETVAANSKGSDFEGLALTFKSYGRQKHLNTSQVV